MVSKDDDIHHITVNGEPYQIRSADEPGVGMYIITRSGETLCQLSRNDNGKWQADCDIGEHIISGFSEWIKKLYE